MTELDPQTHVDVIDSKIEIVKDLLPGILASRSIVVFGRLASYEEL